MNPTQSWMPVVQNPIQDMVVEAVRTALPTIHTQLNQLRLNSLQVRQAAINATKQSIKASLDADKQFFELAQATLPIAHKHTTRMHMSMLEIQDAMISAVNQAMEQSLKTDQQLYDACLEMLNKDSQQDVAVEDAEAEVEIEVDPEEVIVEEEVVAED